jgi:hypothetical protein
VVLYQLKRPEGVSGYMPTKFRKKPVVIEAMQYSLESRDSIIEWCGGKYNVISTAIDDDGAEYELENIKIRTLEGDLTVSFDDWIIKGIKGEFYPCKPDIFEQTYEAVELDDGPLSETEMRSARGI